MDIVGAGQDAARRAPNKYQVIYADPPWDFKNYSKFDDDKSNKAYGRPLYKTMPVSEICGLKVSEIADDSCVLFMWVTMPFLEKGFDVITAWGFEYKTCAFVWVKTTSKGIYSGLGHWTCGNAELCLLATKKKFPKRISCNVKQILMEPKTIHSRKPNEIRKRIVALLGDIPRIELFARQRVEGWDAWGNEIEESPVLVEESPAQNIMEICHTAPNTAMAKCQQVELGL